MRCSFRWLLPLSVLAAGCGGGDPQPYFAPQERDRLLREIVQTRSYSTGQPSAVTITPDGDAVLFLQAQPGSRVQDLYSFDVATRESRMLISADQLLGGGQEVVSPEEKARRERQRVSMAGITSYSLSEDGSLVLIPLSGRLYVLERGSGSAKPLEGVEDVTDARFSPDGRYVSFVKDHDLHWCEWRMGTVQQVTHGGTEAVSHGEAEFVAQEEMSRHTGYWWSPDSTRLAYQETDNREVETLHIADPAAPYRAPYSSAYPRAGEKNAVVRLGVVSMQGGETTWIDWDREAYPYLATVKWPKNSPLTILVQNRLQQEEILYRVDHSTGALSELLRDRDPAWINLDQSMPMWLESARQFLWTSEAEGETRLSLHDETGRLIRVLNPDNSFRLRGVLHLDERRGVVVVSGSDYPPENHLYELPLADGNARRLTERAGSHSRSYGRGHNIYVSRHEDLKSRSGAEVHRADGTLLGVLPSRAPTPPFAPNVELLRVGPNPEFDASIVRPRNFRSGLKYPVIVSVYGGPSGGVVHASGRGYIKQQWYADQGFIVVSSDNRGVGNRGRAWERAIYGNFGDIPLDDQIAALQAIGARYPELDLTRVGIMGWSFGGYMSALAVAKRSDVFHAAAAGAPVVEWTDYDTHYTERYLGLPQDNAEGYRKSSVLTYADKLTRPLLLVHGTADDNVYFGNSLKLADALFRAGKWFDFIPLKGYTHLVPDPDMSYRVDSRIAEFFRTYLIDHPPLR